MARARHDAGFLRLANATLVVNLGVILWGAFVRASGSGAGCGSHWPLCNGEVIPRAPTVETLIELSHRLTSGVALLMVVALAVLAWRRFALGSPVRRYALLTLVLMLVEAGIGAGIVLFELVADNESMARALFMAVHLANTFLLLGALILVIHTAEGNAAPRWRSTLARPGGWLLLAAVVGTIAVGSSGAVAALGDTLHPSKTLAEALAADFSPTSSLLIRLRALHPTIALVVGALLLVIGYRAKDAAENAENAENTGLARWGRWLTVGVLGQIALGFINVLLLAPIPIQLLHLLIADLLWIALIRVVAIRAAMPDANSVASLARATT